MIILYFLIALGVTASAVAMLVAVLHFLVWALFKISDIIRHAMKDN